MLRQFAGPGRVVLRRAFSAGRHTKVRSSLSSLPSRVGAGQSSKSANATLIRHKSSAASAAVSEVKGDAYEAAEFCERASAGDVKGVQALLDAGHDVNSRDYDNRTALHLAAANGTFVCCWDLSCELKKLQIDPFSSPSFRRRRRFCSLDRILFLFLLFSFLIFPKANTLLAMQDTID